MGSSQDHPGPIILRGFLVALAIIISKDQPLRLDGIHHDRITGVTFFYQVA